MSSTDPAETVVDRSRRSHWRDRIVVLLVLAAILGAIGWRYRVSRPDYRLARGREAIAAKDWSTADTTVERLQNAGASDHAHLLCGELLHARGLPAAAIAELNQIEAEGAIRVQAAATSGQCLLELGDLKEAHRVLSYVVDHQPDHVDAWRGLAAVAYDLGQLDAAVDYLRRVAELDPDDARPHRLIGLIYKDMAQHEDAIAAYRESLRRGLAADAASEVRLELAEVLLARARYAEALAILDEHPEDSTSPAARAAVRAECLRGLGQRDRAVRILDEALHDHPSDSRLLRVRGQIFLDDGRPEEAIPLLERAAAAAPHDYQGRYLLGQAYSARGRKDDAARELAKAEAIRLDLERITSLSKEAMARPWDAPVRLELAEVCDRLGKPELAKMWRAAAAACRGQPKF